MQILVVEDEPKIAAFIKKGLTEQRYSVDIAKNGQEAIDKCFINQYDLILLDLMIPLVDGLSVCRELRKEKIQTPILMVTAKDAVESKVTGLDAGADDYLTKPFSFAELTARIRALLRREPAVLPVILQVGEIVLNPATRIVTNHGQEIQFTAKEFALLEYFMRHQNQVLTKSEIIEHVWDVNYEGMSNIVETYVKYIRQKLQRNPQDPELIQTIRGSGYILKSK